ncbi:MAG: phosphatase PAP2 family protein [Bacteroidetes bacterium]|nr:phosphatase PAP2 family protein [Bacteroidota bacterium]
MLKTFQNMLQFDTWLFLYIFELTDSRFTKKLFYTISKSADGYIYAVCAVCILLLDHQRGVAFLMSGVIAFSLETSLYFLIKKSIRRKRPFETLEGIRFLIQPPDKFSFPSGHTAAAFVFATLVGTFYPVVFIPLVAFASLVGFSRIYLGVHYPGDVLAGSVLGILSARIGLLSG